MDEVMAGVIGTLLIVFFIFLLVGLIELVYMQYLEIKVREYELMDLELELEEDWDEEF